MDEQVDVPGLGRYALRGCAVHKDGVTGGHYVATVRRGDRWWNFDDGIVEPTTLAAMQADRHVRTGAYILLYEREPS